MATISFDEKVVVTDPEIVAMMKKDIEGEVEKAMTDEQVKKGLECCANLKMDNSKCYDECPYRNESCFSLYSDALALINRREDEKEQIRKETAKRILQSFAQFRAVSPNLSAVWYELAKKYDVEVEK